MKCSKCGKELESQDSITLFRDKGVSNLCEDCYEKWKKELEVK